MRNILLTLIIACLSAAAITLYAGHTGAPPEVQDKDNKSKETYSYKVREISGILDIKEIHSRGGLSAWLVEDHSVPVISISFAFKNAGSVTDPENKQGRAQIVSNTLDEGAGELNAKEFQKTLRDNAIHLSFRSSRDALTGNLETLSKNKDKAFNLLHLALTQPRFDPAPLERMKNANIARIKREMQKPRWRALRLAYSKAFEEHPYALNSGGTITGIKNITPEDLKDFAQEYLGQDNLVIGISGDITEKQAAKALDKIFADLPAYSKKNVVEDISLQNNGAHFHHPMDIPQTHFQLWHPGKPRSSKEYAELSILNNIFGQSGFGSRLMSEAREKQGLTYGIYSHLRHFNRANTLVITTSTKNKSTEEMRDIIIREMSRLSRKGITQQELKATKKYITGSLPLKFTSNPSVSSTLMSLQLHDQEIDFLDRYQENIRKAKLGKVNKLASEFFRYENIMSVTVGQADDFKRKPDMIIKDLPDVR